MITQIVNLEKEYGIKGTLDCIVHEYPGGAGNKEKRRPAVIVAPGGAYAFLSDREALQIGYAFLAKGFQAFVLHYSVSQEGACYPEQLIQIGAAIDYIKKNAEMFFVCPDEVFAVGFSAGGHLVGNLAVEWDKIPPKYGKELDCKVKAVGLCYPVISSETGYKDSHENLLQGYTEETKQELLKVLDLDKAVGGQTPPTFIWTTAEDNIVPSENSLLFALALARNKIPYELHVYPQGPHGLSTCDFEVNNLRESYLKKNAQWLNDCADFFRLYTEDKF